MRRSMVTMKGAATPPSFVSVSAASNSGSVNKPASVANGDVVLILAGNTASGSTVTPSGFTVVDTILSGSTRIAMFARQLDGSEGSTFTVSGSDFAAAVAYRNISPTKRASATATETGGFSTTVTYPAVASAAGDAVVGFLFAAVATTSSTPTGNTERFDATAGSAMGQIIDVLPAAGATSAATGTFGATTSAHRITIRAAFPAA